MNRTNRPEWLRTLEDGIDGSSLHDVLSAVSEICFEKGKHLRETWQDGEAAKAWDRAGWKLDQLSTWANGYGL